MTEVAGKAAELRRLHAGPGILVLVNVWDVASARTVAALPGCRAIATGSWPIAASLGVPDGEVLTRAEMLAVAGRIAAAVDLPVTADLEAGYGSDSRGRRRDRPPRRRGRDRRLQPRGRGATAGGGRRPGRRAPVGPRTPTAPGSSSTPGSTWRARRPGARGGGGTRPGLRRRRRRLRLPDRARGPTDLIGEFVQRVGAPSTCTGRPGGPVRSGARGARRRTGQLRPRPAGRRPRRAETHRHRPARRRRRRREPGVPPAV